ncbi:metallophosphoesterase, partial [uncultured Kingella sp.]
MPLIQSLPGCPLDIIGDVHGQFEALQNLLHYLGYSPAGKHPQGRKLVFVGDLIDRGPDSPAVADWAKQAIHAGNAFMVLGNHEINLLAHEPKDGSGWFFDCRAGKDSRNYAPWQRQPENGKKALVQFFAEQPLVLQRPDLRIVHAAWLPESIAKLQNNATPLIQLIQEWDDELHCCIKHAPWYDDYLAEQHHHAHILENPAQHPP